MIKKYFFLILICTCFTITGCNDDEISVTEDCIMAPDVTHPKAVIYQSVIDKYTARGLPGISILIRDIKELGLVHLVKQTLMLT